MCTITATTLWTGNEWQAMKEELSDLRVSRRRLLSWSLQGVVWELHDVLGVCCIVSPRQTCYYWIVQVSVTQMQPYSHALPACLSYLSARVVFVPSLFLTSYLIHNGDH
jgi:hypothetical protein